MTIWPIWKSRNKNSINNHDVAISGAKEELKELLRDLITKAGTRCVSWKVVGG
jgi:hypothetical protein